MIEERVLSKSEIHLGYSHYTLMIMNTLLYFMWPNIFLYAIFLNHRMRHLLQWCRFGFVCVHCVCSYFMQVVSEREDRVYCLHHAYQMITKTKMSGRNFKLLYRYSEVSAATINTTITSCIMTAHTAYAATITTFTRLATNTCRHTFTSTPF